jgi:membrane-bound lytic murein transglycosylase B
MGLAAFAFVLASALLPCAAFAADAGFTQFIASLWPEAQAAGVSRATFDAQTSGLEPDYKLPDLILPGRPATGAPSQAEFVQVPADYVKEASIARLAEEGQRLMQKYSTALAGIEKRFGVPATMVLAIPISAVTRTPMTRSACWRRRPMSAGARTPTATNSSWR